MSKGQQNPHRPWTVNSEIERLSIPPFLKVIQQDVTTSRGERVENFYKVILRNFALVVPYLENGKVLMIRQYKHGAGKTVIGFPAGFCEPDEDPAEAAHRELLEETGLVSDDLVSMGSFVDNGNQRGALGNYFLAKNCKLLSKPDPGDLEEFEYVEMEPAQIDQAIKEGHMSVIHHVAAWGMVGLYAD